MQIQESEKNEINRLIKRGKKLDAVKLVRERYDLALRDALKLVEALQAGEEIRFNTFQRVPFPGNSFGKKDKTFGIVAKLMLVLGVMLCAIAAALVYDKEKEIEDSERVLGKVVELRGTSTFSPVVQFTYQGQSRQVVGGASSNPPAYQLGEEVGVYLVDEPAGKVYIDSITELWIIPIVLAIIGGVFLFIGAVFYALR